MDSHRLTATTDPETQPARKGDKRKVTFGPVDTVIVASMKGLSLWMSRGKRQRITGKQVDPGGYFHDYAEEPPGARPAAARHRRARVHRARRQAAGPQGRLLDMRPAGCSAALAASGCSGTPLAAATAHPTHSLAAAGVMVMCTKCGGHGVAAAAKLRKPCLGACSSKSAADRLKRLHRGRRPTANEDVGAVVNLT